MTDRRKIATNDTENQVSADAGDEADSGVADQADAQASDAGRSASTPCPICEKDAMETNEAYPFCSMRCKNVDLGRWLDGAYVISRPIEQDDLEQED